MEEEFLDTKQEEQRSTKKRITTKSKTEIFPKKWRIKECKIVEGILNEDSNGDVYVEYVIWLSDGECWWEILRRYSHFHALHSLLKKKYFSSLPSFPKKSLFGTFFVTSDFIETRRKSLEMYLQNLLNHPIFSKSDELINFLSKAEPLASHSRQDPIQEQEKIHDMAANPIFLVPALNDTLLSTLQSLFGQEVLHFKESYSNLVEVFSKLTTFSLSIGQVSAGKKLAMLDASKSVLEKMVHNLETKEEEFIRILGSKNETFWKQSEESKELFQLLNAILEIIQLALDWNAKIEGNILDEIAITLNLIQERLQYFQTEIDQLSNNSSISTENVLEKWVQLKSEIVEDKTKIVDNSESFLGFKIFLSRIQELEIKVDFNLEQVFVNKVKLMELNLKQLFENFSQPTFFNSDLIEENLRKWKESAIILLDLLTETENFIGKRDLFQKMYHLSEEIAAFEITLDKKLVSKSILQTFQTANNLIKSKEKNSSESMDAELEELKQ